ncbi:MAG: 16S rRNA (guanine(527)-N(7))-methyltransferase RsmG [Clostridiales bacterium]|nr:16S rRNA (guanine(527)-N(7))-methyltransferase RsmG [Clostridiales bacterium]
MSIVTDVLLNTLGDALTLDVRACERFEIYASLLSQWNKKFNLTAITEPSAVAVKHFADSLMLLKYIDVPQGAKLIDVGTGAGFPGVALLIARNDIKLTAIDGTGKKLDFVRMLLNELGLDAEVVHVRAEEAGQSADFREKFDVATARAVASLNELCEYCMPFVRIGGTFAPMKGAAGEDELKLARGALKLLGGEIAACECFNLPECGERCVINIKKISQTPPRYPRPSAQIAKRPL